MHTALTPNAVTLAAWTLPLQLAEGGFTAACILDHEHAVPVDVICKSLLQSSSSTHLRM